MADFNRPRRRGRPAGSKDPVVADKPFGLDAYAAVRAYVKGVRPLAACRQYLLNDEAPTTEEAAMRQLSTVMERISSIGESRRHGPDAESNARNAKAAAHLRSASHTCLKQLKDMRMARKKAQEAQAELLRQEAAMEGLLPLPKAHGLQLPDHFASLAAFERHYDRVARPDDPLDSVELDAKFEEFKSDWFREQGYLYKPNYAKSKHSFAEQTGIRSAIAHAVGPKIKLHTNLDSAIAVPAEAALATLEWTVQRRPQAADVIDAWIGGTTRKHLKAQDVFTLYTLGDLIRRRRAAWWREVPGLGPVRAKRLVTWLADVGVQGVEIPSDLGESIQRRRLEEIRSLGSNHPALPSSLVDLGLEPLAPYCADDTLNGRHGLFRQPGANQLKADTDIDAIVVALGKYKDKGGTLTVYAREVCRFALWAYREKAIPISSVGVDEARQYREFLAAIPAHWISTCRDAAPRGTQAWRPFRGQLDEATQRKALTAVNVILKQLTEAGYLTGNPMAGVLKQAGLPRPTVDFARSLTLEEWSLICEMLDKVEEDAQLKWESGACKLRDPRPGSRRLKALLHVLQSTGLRRDELFKARLSNVTKISVDGATAFLLKVTGKRSKIRDVVLHSPVMLMLEKHLADRSSMFTDDPETSEGREKIPLISVLAEPLVAFQFSAAEADEAGTNDREIVATRRAPADSSGALGPDGMKLIMRSFFKKCAREAELRGLDSAHFETATLHWLRHTFGHAMADANVDVRIIQKAMGHSNINTSGGYIKAELEQMVRGLRRGNDESERASASLRRVATASGSAPELTQE